MSVQENDVLNDEEKDFLNQVDDLFDRVTDVLNQEEHQGLIVAALQHLLAANVYDMITYNPSDESFEQRVKDMHDQLDILLDEMRNGRYFNNNSMN